MALFGRKKTDETAKPGANGTTGGTGAGGTGGGAGRSGGSGTGEGDGMEFSPDKAHKFFERAKTVHEATNYEYAVTLWLNGLRQDPSSMDALLALFVSAAAFLNSKEGAKGASRDTVKEFASGRSDLERYLFLLLQTALKRTEASPAVRSAESAAKLGLWPAATWLAERGFQIALAEKRPRKDHFVTLMNVFRTVEAFDKAVKVGEVAVRLAPEDGKLAGEVRNLSAESTMTRGGYEQAGKEGGFRQNIRDAESQKRLEEEERLVRTEETHDRMIDRARMEYEGNPSDRALISRYVKLLNERRRPVDDETALAVLERAYKDTQEFRFREQAGEVRLRRLKLDVARLKEAAEKAGPDDAGAAEAYEAAKRNLVEQDIDEWRARVEAYPSDRVCKFELGKRLFEAGRFEESIGFLQAAKDEPKQRIRVQGYLGQAFLAIEIFDGAIEMFRSAIEAAGNIDGELGMELRYGLMQGLQGRAKEYEDIGSAEEAYRIATSIAIQQFTYRDIKQRREDLKDLVARLKRGDSAAM